MQKHSHMLMPEINELFYSSSRCMGYVLAAESTDWLFLKLKSRHLLFVRRLLHLWCLWGNCLREQEPTWTFVPAFSDLCELMLCELVFSVTIAALHVTEAAVHLQDLQQDLIAGTTDNGKRQIFFWLFLGRRGERRMWDYISWNENIFQNN